MSLFLENIWIVLNELAPWLLIGCFAAGLIHILIPASFMTRHLGSGTGSVFKAVFLGVPMPLCSCGVIPAAIGLKKQGAGDGASIGFLISTPQTGVDSILVSASFLSWPFAIFKLISAFILGVVGGLLCNQTSENKSEEVQPQHDSDKKGIAAVYEFAVNDLLYMIWKWLVIGVLASAAITTWIPQDLISGWKDMPLILSLLLVLAVSVPLYVCATSSVPIAFALVQAGMPTSAALVFLMAGPATNFATIGAVYKGFGLRNLIIYLSTIIFGSIILAYCFDFVLSVSVPQHVHEHGVASSVSVYLLLFFFFIFILRDIRSFLPGKVGSENLEFNVDGLTCQGCVKKLSAGLNKVEGVSSVIVELESGSVKVSGSQLSKEKIADSIQESGFSHKNLLT